MPILIRNVTQQAVKVASVARDRLQRPDAGVVILIYHRVGRRSSLEVDLPTSLFEEQMALLAQRNCVATLDDALAWLDNADDVVTDPPVVVTFDDGTADLLDVALPILERHAIPSTLYVATDFVDRGLSFPADGVALSWRGLAEMCASGLVTIGSHTHSHALFDRLAASEAVHEIERSNGLIEEHLGVQAAHFAYPKAVAPSAANEALVRRTYRSAALAGTRPNRRGGTDVHRLSRSPVQLGDGMRWFERKVAGGMGLEDDLRRTANRWRYARASK